MGNSQAKQTRKLVTAVESADGASIREALSKGADPNYIYPDTGNTLLHIAARKGIYDVAAALLEAENINTSIRNKKGYLAFHIAVMEGNTYIAAAFVKKAGVSVTATTSTGYTPIKLLSTFVKHPKRDVIEKLIELGSDPSEVDKNGWSNLHYAAQNGRQPVIDVLTANGADINMKTIPGGTTPLHLAVLGGHVNLVRHLIQNLNADVSITDDNGRKALDRLLTEFSHSKAQQQEIKAILLEAEKPKNLTVDRLMADVEISSVGSSSSKSSRRSKSSKKKKKSKKKKHKKKKRRRVVDSDSDSDFEPAGSNPNSSSDSDSSF